MVDIDLLPFLLVLAVTASLAAVVLVTMVATNRRNGRKQHAYRRPISPLARLSGEFPTASVEKSAVPDV